MRIADDRFGGRFATMAGTLRISSSQGNSCPKSLLGQVCSHIRSIGAGFKCSCVSRFADFCSGSNSTFVRVMHFLFQRREGGLTGPWGSSRVAFASLVSLELFCEDCWLGKRFHIQQLGFWLAQESTSSYVLDCHLDAHTCRHSGGGRQFGAVSLGPHQAVFALCDQTAAC